LAPFSLFQKEKPDIEHHPLKFIPELHMLEIQADVQIWLYFTTVIHSSIPFHSHSRFRSDLTHPSSQK
jgi:hypothetical protein